MLFGFIRANLVLRKYTYFEELLSELPLEEWAAIWKVQKDVAEKKIADPAKLIMRDFVRTADYFKVTTSEIFRLTSDLRTKSRKPKKLDILDCRVYTFHRIILLLDKYLISANEEYRTKSDDDRRRTCLLAVDDLLRKFDPQ